MRREKKTKKNKNVIKDWFLTFLGIGLVVAGFLIHKNSVSSTDKMIVTIPYIYLLASVVGLLAILWAI